MGHAAPRRQRRVHRPGLRHPQRLHRLRRPRGRVGARRRGVARRELRAEGGPRGRSIPHRRSPIDLLAGAGGAGQAHASDVLVRPRGRGVPALALGPGPVGDAQAGGAGRGLGDATRRRRRDQGAQRALLDRAGGGGRGRGRGVSRGTARPARREGDARAVAAVRGGGGAQGDPAGEGVDANDGKRPEFAVRNAHRTTSPRS